MRGLIHNRALTLLLLAAVLAAKLLMPAGWMPVAEARGITMVLCSGDGPSEGWLDTTGKFHKGHQPGEDRGKDRSGAKDACPYGALGAPAEVQTAALAVAPVFAPAVPVFVAPAPVAIGRGLAAPPPPARGPPLNA